MDGEQHWAKCCTPGKVNERNLLLEDESTVKEEQLQTRSPFLQGFNESRYTALWKREACCVVLPNITFNRAQLRIWALCKNRYRRKHKHKEYQSISKQTFDNVGQTASSISKGLVTHKVAPKRMGTLWKIEACCAMKSQPSVAKHRLKSRLALHLGVM